jgi:hypothetical protein
MAPLLSMALFGLAAIPLVNAAVRSLDGVRKDVPSDIVPAKYIIEFNNPPAISNFGKRATVR